MKKIYYLIASAVVAVGFTACTQSDLLEGSTSDASLTSADNAIQFGTYLGKVGTTRGDYSAGPITNATSGDNSLRNAKFGVFAYYTGAKNYRGETTTPNLFDWTSTNSNGTWKKDESNKYTNFMYNQQITWSTSNPTDKWVYSPVKYWPNGEDGNTSGPSTTAVQKESGKLSFFAYAPYVSTTTFTADASDQPTDVTAKVAASGEGVIGMSTNVSNSNVWLKYKLHSGKENENVDLLWGTRGDAQYNLAGGTDPSVTIGAAYNENLTKQKVDETVKFLFKHATAKIGGSEKNTSGSDPKHCGFKVVVDVDDNAGPHNPTGQKTYFSEDFANTSTLVTIEWVKIQDGKTASEDDTNGLSGKTSTLQNVGWFNIEEGKWDKVNLEGTGATYNVWAVQTKDVENAKYELNTAIKEFDSNNASSYTTGTPLVWNVSSGVTKGVSATSATDLFSNADDVPALQVIPGGTTQDLYISVKYWVRTIDANLNKTYTEVPQIITNQVSLTSLQPNKYYTIIMHLGLTSVKFEAVVADWETTSDGTYAENGTYTPGSTPNEAKVWLPSNVVPAP